MCACCLLRLRFPVRQREADRSDNSKMGKTQRTHVTTIPKPRRLRTAYSYFVHDTYHKVAGQLATQKPQPIISRLGEMWRQMKPLDRAPFMKLETNDRYRYTQAKTEWARQHAGRPMSYLNRQRKETGAPRRPQSAYVFFKIDQLNKMRKDNPGMLRNDQRRAIVDSWHRLEEKIRNEYKNKEQDDRTRYSKEMYEFREEQKKSIVAEQAKRLKLLESERLVGDKK